MKLNELTTKVKEGVKKHWKKGVVIVVGGVVVGGVTYYIGYKAGSSGKMGMPKDNWFMESWSKGDHKPLLTELVGDFRIGDWNHQKDLDKPNTDLGEIIDLWTEVQRGENTLNTIVHDVNINDLGWLAADIADKTFDKYPETKGMTQIDAVLTYYKPEVKDVFKEV